MTAEVIQQIKAMLYQNMDKVDADDTWGLIESYAKEHAIEFACCALIGTGKLDDEDIPTLKKEVTDFYEKSEWEAEFIK